MLTVRRWRMRWRGSRFTRWRKRRGFQRTGTGWIAYARSPVVLRAWNRPWVAPRDDQDTSFVLLSPDYGYELPLSPDCWSRLGLSRTLLDDLADWQRTFDRSFDPFAGGFESSEVDQWRLDGESLERRLRVELGPNVEVVAGFWPPGDSENSARA